MLRALKKSEPVPPIEMIAYSSSESWSRLIISKTALRMVELYPPTNPLSEVMTIYPDLRTGRASNIGFEEPLTNSECRRSVVICLIFEA